MIFYYGARERGGGFSQPEPTPQELERQRNRMATNAGDKATRAALIAKMQMHAADLHQGGKGVMGSRSYLHIDPATSQPDLDKIYAHLADMTPEPLRAKYGLASKVPAPAAQPLNNTVGAAMDKAGATASRAAMVAGMGMAGMPLGAIGAQSAPTQPTISGETKAAVPASNPALDATTAARATLGPGAGEDAVARKAALDQSLAGQGARADAIAANNVAQVKSNQAQGVTGTFSNAAHGTVTQGAPQPDINGMAGNVYDPRTDISHAPGLASFKYVPEGGTNVMTAGDTGRPSNIPIPPTVQGSTNNRTVGLPVSQGKPASVAPSTPAIASSNPAANAASANPIPTNFSDVNLQKAGVPQTPTFAGVAVPPTTMNITDPTAAYRAGQSARATLGGTVSPIGDAAKNAWDQFTNSPSGPVQTAKKAGQAVAGFFGAQPSAPTPAPAAPGTTSLTNFGGVPASTIADDEDEKRRQAALAARQPVTSL